MRSCALRKIIVGAGLAASVTGGAAAATAFDGIWSVTLETEQGSCAPRRGASVAVADGRVSYAGGEPIVASGAVAESGRVNISFNYEGDQLDARGSVRGSVGAGSWESQTANCSGSWMARRARG